MDYRQLDFSKYETRLLKLYPSSSINATKPVVCELVHGVSFNPAQPSYLPYIALSYCWGDASVIARIVVDGKVVQVRENLAAALKQLRRSITKPSHFWIDALCINQEDPYEKREQVRNMGTIYSYAERVLAWVGTPTKPQQTDKSFAYFQEPSKVAQLDRTTAESFKLFISSFGAAPYWRRTWIIQELARGEPFDIQYGALKISWRKLKSALFSAEIQPYLSPDFHALIQVLDEFQQRERQDTWRRGRLRFTLLEALFQSRNSLASDPRDKIYALIGLASDGDLVVPLPSYSQLWEESYKDAAEYIIAGQGKVMALLLAGRNDLRKQSDRKRQLPSWVPNWATLDDCGSAPWISKCIKHSADANDIPITKTEASRLRLPGVVHETIVAVFSSASSSAKIESDPTALPKTIDVRTFVWHLYNAIHWTNIKYKDFSRSDDKTLFSRIRDAPSRVGDKVHALGFTTSSLKYFVEFLRLLLNEYDLDEESAASVQVQDWMQRNGSLKVGSSTVAEMLEEQLNAMQSAFSSRDAPAIDVIPPGDGVRPQMEKSKSDSRVPRLPERLRRMRWPSSSGHAAETEDQSGTRNEHNQMTEHLGVRNPPSRSPRRSHEEDRPTRILFQGSGSLTMGGATIRGDIQSLFTNREPLTENSVVALAAALEKIHASEMRLAVTDRRIRIVHKYADVGDKIAFLPNCPLPVVLRPVPGSSRYRYIGEAYSEAFARLFKENWGDKKSDKPFEVWEVEGVKIDRKEFVVIE